jgi:hypothetical protein
MNTTFSTVDFSFVAPASWVEGSRQAVDDPWVYRSSEPLMQLTARVWRFQEKADRAETERRTKRMEVHLRQAILATTPDEPLAESDERWHDDVYARTLRGTGAPGHWALALIGTPWRVLHFFVEAPDRSGPTFEAVARPILSSIQLLSGTPN